MCYVTHHQSIFPPPTQADHTTASACRTRLSCLSLQLTRRGICASLEPGYWDNIALQWDQTATFRVVLCGQATLARCRGKPSWGLPYVAERLKYTHSTSLLHVRYLCNNCPTGRNLLRREGRDGIAGWHARVPLGARRRCISVQRVWRGTTPPFQSHLVFLCADKGSSVCRFLKRAKHSNLVRSPSPIVPKFVTNIPQAGNRWHIDCFRCNTCGTLLDSDANLLLLGDGSLICNNCTYSCSACGNKIEDLAILTGDQAFCASCFKCRNCKKKIENLRYARTSQGIFCMECHESLMARRRKKSAKNSSRHKQSSNNTMLLDKSLPSLPPSAVHQSAPSPPERETPPSEVYSETPTELAVPTSPPPPPPPPPQKHSSRKESSRIRQRGRSPSQQEPERKGG